MRRIAVIAAASAALLLSACGDDDNASGTSGASGGSSSSGGSAYGKSSGAKWFAMLSRSAGTSGSAFSLIVSEADVC